MAMSRMHRLISVVALVLFIVFLGQPYYIPRSGESLTQLPALKNSSGPEFPAGIAKAPSKPYTKTIVMARMKSQDVSWVYEELEGFNKSIYTVDDDSAELCVPRNKGHESMAYLTYIIDNYDNLPDTVLFFHSHRSAWHNNILLDLDSAKTIQRLNPARVAREGYFNARCHHDPGCPNWLHIDRPENEWDFEKKKEEQYLTSRVWQQLHLNAPPPQALSQACCAQFAVSGDRIRARPVGHYQRYRQWLLDTDVSDEFSGRILEYNWQYIFTGKGEFCPPQHECYCDGFGICFGGTTDENLQHWLDLLRQREILDGQLNEWRKDWVQHQEQIFNVENEKTMLARKLDNLKQEAYQRGEDPQNRALECGRPWKEGDGF
jgi:Protein of unknown function (DUF3431)